MFVYWGPEGGETLISLETKETLTPVAIQHRTILSSLSTIRRRRTPKKTSEERSLIITPRRQEVSYSQLNTCVGSQFRGNCKQKVFSRAPDSRA